MVVKVVESIAVHGAHQPQGTTVRDAPPFVAKAVQDQLAATSKHVLQQFVLRTIAPTEELVKASFSNEGFLRIDAAQVGPPRQWVRQTCHALLDIATESSALLPAGDPLPPALVRHCPLRVCAYACMGALLAELMALVQALAILLCHADIRRVLRISKKHPQRSGHRQHSADTGEQHYSPTRHVLTPVSHIMVAFALVAVLLFWSRHHGANSLFEAFGCRRLLL